MKMKNSDNSRGNPPRLPEGRDTRFFRTLFPGHGLKTRIISGIAVETWSRICFQGGGELKSILYLSDVFIKN